MPFLFTCDCAAPAPTPAPAATPAPVPAPSPEVPGVCFTFQVCCFSEETIADFCTCLGTEPCDKLSEICPSSLASDVPPEDLCEEFFADDEPPTITVIGLQNIKLVQCAEV